MTTKAELLKKVRQGCSECMGGPRGGENVWPIPNPGDVDNCTAPQCVWYDFRFGRDPNPAKGKVEAARRRIIENGGIFPVSTRSKKDKAGEGKE